MAFDGVFLHKVICELHEAVDTHIDKIYQPSKDELVFLLRKKNFAKRLLINIKSGSARIHLTENKYENPAVPPNFCMLLRKYLSSARIISITQPEFERIAEIKISATNELGDIVILSLICELIGNQANVILLNESGIVIDAMRRSDVESAQRLILPGAIYEKPKSQNKISPLNLTCEILDSIVKEEHIFEKKLLQTVDGFSPLICRELEYQIEKYGTQKTLNNILRDINSIDNPVLVLNFENLAIEFSYTNIEQYGNSYKNKAFNSFSELLDEYYTSKDIASKINTAAHDIIKLLNTLLSRTQKRLALRLNELKKCKDREHLRIYGELLKANLYSIKNGSYEAKVQNYYDENLSFITIPLNPALSVSKNADRYFKDYKKTYSAEQTLEILTKEDKKELLYFESVLDSISRCTNLREIEEIRNELIDCGYLKRKSNIKKQKSQKPTFSEDVSQEGYRILIGKNNMQNDYITTHLASKNDVWFHVKDFPGSHVVVFCDGKELSDATIIKAATIAAKNSKACNSSNVAVDYTPIKFVKKPTGAKPGMVTYSSNKTVFVTPKGD